MYGCIVESHESTRQRPEPWQSQIHEDRIAGNYFFDTLQFGAQVYSGTTSDEASGCRSCPGQGMEKLETVPAWNLEKVKSKKELILEAQRDKKEDPFFHIDGLMSPLKCGVGTETTEVQRQSRALERTLSNTTLEPTHFY